MVSLSASLDNLSMTQNDAAHLDQLCQQQLPLRPGVCVRCTSIGDYSSALYEEEAEAINQAIAKRRDEFATGRWLARRTMAQLELPIGIIGRGEQRQPLWPSGSVGSITHTDDIAAVAVGTDTSCRSIGIDLEMWPRVTSELHSKLFTRDELAALDGQPAAAAGLLFSAKEAGYKATFPLAERFIGFQEAEIDVDWSQRRFSIRYVGKHTDNSVMEQGEGYFLISDQYALSLFLIP